MTIQTSNLDALCQAILLEGVPRSEETRIESSIRRTITNNGPEFVIDRLKVIKQFLIDNIDEKPQDRLPFQNQQGQVQVAWNHKTNEPKGEMRFFIRKNTEKSLRLVGAAISAIKLDEMSDRQIEKFKDGLKHNFRSKAHAHYSDRTLSRLEKSLMKRWKNKPAFSAKELSGSVLPDGNLTVNIANSKKVLSRRSHIGVDTTAAIAALDHEAVNQFYNAPSITGKLWRYSARIAGNPHTFSRKISQKPHISRDYESKPGFYTQDMRPYLGTITILQQAGGKARTIANVNRFVNSVMDPFARSLQDTFYGNPSISVSNQSAGMRWAQDKLRAGVELASIDLSSATDLLDFRAVIDPLIQDSRDKYPLVNASAIAFKELSQLPLYSRDLETSVAFRTGQPLGMKGSFQVLTIMNLSAANYAAQKNHLDLNDSFRIVGDDFICDSSMAGDYINAINQLGGKTNSEKMIVSSHHAEFLSHVITKDHIYPLKPKYSAKYQNPFSDVEKSTLETVKKVYKLDDSTRSALDAVASVSDLSNSYSNVPAIRSSYKLDSNTRLTIRAALKELSMLATEPSDGVETVSAQSLDLADQVFVHLINKESLTSPDRSDRRIYNLKPDGTREYIRSARGPVHHGEDGGEFSTIVDRYDHKSASRKTLDEHPARAFKELAKRISLLRDDLENGNEHNLSIGHNVQVSTTDLLISAMDDVEKVRINEILEKKLSSDIQLIVPKHGNENQLDKASISQSRTRKSNSSERARG